MGLRLHGHESEASGERRHFTALSSCFSENISFYNEMFPYVALAKDKQWLPGPYAGVELLPLHKNEQTGGLTVLRKFHAGTAIPAHIHPEASEFVYILSGEWEESGVVHTQGAFFFAPRGTVHGPHLARTEVISLTTFDGPLTVVPAS
jgi:quercetin dioxygenase-like cupin family protein